MCASAVRDATGRATVQGAVAAAGITITASSSCTCAVAAGVPGTCGAAVIAGNSGGKVNLHFKGDSKDAAAPIASTVEVAGQTFPIGLEGQIFYVPKLVFVN